MAPAAWLTKTFSATAPIPMPASDAITATSAVSTRTLRTSCRGVAPSAIRAASSRARDTSRPMKRVATFALATSSTSSAPASAAPSTGRRPPAADSESTVSDTPSRLCGFSSSRTRFASSLNCSSVTPRARRATIFEYPAFCGLVPGTSAADRTHTPTSSSGNANSEGMTPPIV